MPQTYSPVSSLLHAKDENEREEKIGWILRRCIGLVTVFIFVAAIGSHFIHPWAFVGFYIAYFLWSLSLLVESTVFFLRGKYKMNEYSQVDWERKCREVTGKPAEVLSSLVHLIILPNYKEPIEVLSETMQMLADHSYARDKYIICLAMEQAEADCQSKADQLIARFNEYFFRIVTTVHPQGLPGEARGKGPNVSWAVENSMKMLRTEYSVEDVLVTVCDADTHFINDYFTCLSYTYATAADRHNVVFGIPISFYGNALDVPAAVRVTDMVWTITVTQQLSTGRRVRFPCSCYSLSLVLANRVSFWDKGPEAIGEDAHMFLKCLFKTSGEARIETIYIPAGCYNVCGDSWFGSIKARYDQMFRHLWGTFDLAYIIQQSLIMKDMKFSLKFWAFYEMFKVRLLPPTLTWCMMIVPMILKNLFPIYQTDPYFTTLRIVSYVQGFCLLPYIFTAIYYELMHRHIVTTAIARGAALPSQKRGVRHFLLDWFIFPFISILFFTVCSLHVQIRQFFTDNLSYQVAPKPTNSTLKPLEEVVLTGSP